METYKIIIEPDPILHKKSSEITEVTDEIREIFDKMLQTMYENEGMGLAAIQVGIPKKLIVIDIPSLSSKPLYLANAKIIDNSPEISPLDEGCLSLPVVPVTVDRPEKIKISYLNYNGQECELEADGILAKCIQHEIDHTNGITLINHIKSNLKREMALKKLKKFKQMTLRSK